MSLGLTQTKTALASGLTASFLAVGGVSTYVYSVLAGGAGGSINSSSGVYTAPATASSNPKKAYDTIKVTDASGAVATSKILVGSPLLLFCEIIQKEMNLIPGRVYLWDQKIFQPTDSGLYIAVSELSCKPFSNVTRTNPNSGDIVTQSVNMMTTLDIDAISRGPEARDRKEEIILALGSIYAEQQQEGNSFFIGKLPPGAKFTNLSMIDGAAIPYRYKISINIQYTVTKSKAVDYFDSFDDVSVSTEP